MVAYLFILATGLVAVLCVHELGHLLTARYYGIKVLDLSVGFGPELVSFVDRFGTAWKLRAFPIGGSCSLFMPEEGNTTSIAKIYHQSLRQRVAIYAAGPIVNLVCGIAVYGFGLMLSDGSSIFGGEMVSPEAAGAQLIGAFSIGNGLFNLLPFLPMDGGRISLTAIEAHFGREGLPTYEKHFILLSTVITGITTTVIVWAMLCLIAPVCSAACGQLPDFLSALWAGCFEAKARLSLLLPMFR